MAKISQMSRLISINKTIKDLKKDIKTTHDSMKGMKKSKTLIRLEKHVNKAIKGFRIISRSTKNRTHKRGQKYKTSLKISSQDVEDNTCNKGLTPSESVDIRHDSRGIAQDRSLIVKSFGFPNISQSDVGYTPHMRGKDFLPSNKMSVKSSSPDVVNRDDRRFYSFGIAPTKRRSGLPPSDIPEISIQKIERAYGLTSKASILLSTCIKEVVLWRKGFCRNKNEFLAKKNLIDLENSIHRCACHCIADKILPPDWKYDPAIAYTL